MRTMIPKMILAEHLDSICDKVSFERDIPPTRYRRKPLKRQNPRDHYFNYKSHNYDSCGI